MKSRKIYYILISLFMISNIYLSEANYDIHNISGTAEIELIYSDISKTSLKVKVDDYLLIPTENKKFKVYIDKGTSLISQGSPDVPKLSTSIIIPDQGNMKIKIIDSEYIEYSDVDLSSSKGNITRDIEPSSIPYMYNKSYTKNAFYPGELAKLESPYIIRDLRGQTVLFYPVQYNPVTKKLRIYSNITIDVEFIDSSMTKNALSRNSNMVSSNNEFVHMYNNLFINSPNDTRFEYIADDGVMLIICYDDFIDEMQPFVNWKNKKGIHTDIVGLSDIGGTLSSMQDYINNYYYNHNLTYLLLVGDINQMPTHIVNGAASDPSFGFINGDDSFAEVIVGRFSANNPSELQTQIERTINYEMNPGTYTDHLDNALGIASTQGPGYGGLADNAFNDLLWNDFLSPFTYDNYQGIYDGGGSVAQGVAAINEGVGVINYTGHAGPTGWGNGAPLSVNDVHGLTNTGKLPFIFTVGCNPGEFNNYGECFCEAWLRATDDDGNPTGAVGHLGSTISQSWEPPMHGQWAMNAILTESYEGNLSRSFGGIIVNGCMHMNEAQGPYGINETNHWTIFGDPSLLIRTDEPETLNATYNQTISVGQDEFVVDVGIDGALVALSSEGELLSSSYSVGGVAILDLTNASSVPGELDLLISSFNTIPVEDQIAVITPDGAFLVYNGYEFEGTNNFEGYVQYGDQAEINLIVENVGLLNTNAINVTVTSNDEYVTMINGESMIAYAIVNETATTESPISFSVLNSVPDGHLAQFSAFLDDGNNQWEMSFNIEIHAPVFEILNPQITDENQDNIWDAGETAIIDVELANSGSAGFGYYPGAVITTSSPYVTILSEENINTFYGIDANASYQGQFLVQADASVPLGTSVDFNISWGYSSISECFGDCVEQANLVYSVVIGHPSILIWDPSDNHISGNRLVEYFDEIGFNGYDYITSTNVPDVENYLTAFILLGVYPENYMLQEANAAVFVDMLQTGKNIYLEGADTWAFDMQTSLQPMFGLVGISDGSSDLSFITGSLGSFAEGLSFSYNGGNSYVDQLSPSGGFSLLENSPTEYITAVAYQNVLVGYRTIGASHELGGLQGDDFNSYINGILNFFEQGGNNPNPECILGDINSDAVIDVMDIVRVVNIIIGSGELPTDMENCAADLNLDNSIDVLDILIIINLVLDDNNRGFRSHSIVDKVDLLVSDYKLELQSEGPIKGLEIIIKSSEKNISIKDDLSMDIAYNQIGDMHHYLIYDIDGRSILNGSFTLFETKDPFKLVKFMASNTNHKSVDVKYDYTDYVLPETFVLKKNYPNPFNPTTNIEIENNTLDHIRLVIYDVNGRYITTLVDQTLDIGNYIYQWNGKDSFGQSVASGMYLYTLSNSNFTRTQKMLLLK